jgi:single-stranded-DNA-specific exonuclease
LATQIFAGKEWKFPAELELEKSIVQAAEGSEILAKLLVKRGLRTPADIKAFLDPTAYTPCGPEELPDMPRAVARVMQAIQNKEKVTIYGDYDVDGVTATAVMITTLRKLGADVDFYIPSRAEGYGLNLKAVSVLASKHRTKLIITCDCGISNFSEINFARSLGVDTVVVDHHTMPELLPPAAAILHPKVLNEEHPLFHLPGVGVAYKLAEALLIQNGKPEEVEKLLDFVTLGMIADMVPLTKECRYLVQVGMPVLVKSERAGIKALLAQVAGRSNDGTDLVGFGLAPRINAVGRLSDANLAVKLMITEDADEAGQLANQLELENARRQELCEQIFTHADSVAAGRMMHGDKAIAIYDERWHHGVVGIVASRLVEKYHCPVFIGELDPDEGIVKGSARGIAGIDLYEVLKANEHLALKWGGHKMAAGFSVEAGKADLFCKSLVETCNRMLAEQSMRPTLEIDLALEPAEVTMELAQTLTRLAPFGMANKKPVIAVRGGECANTRVLGKDGKHHRITVACDGGTKFECVMWNSRGRIPADGQSCDIAFAPELNTFNGTTRLQLVLSDWRDPNAPEPVMNFAPPPAVAGAGTAAGGVAAAAGAAASNSTTAAPSSSAGLGSWAEAGAAAGGMEPRETAPHDVAPHASAPHDSSPHPIPSKENLDVSPPAGPTINWKDMRNHATPEGLVQAALRKLGATVAVFAEAAPKLNGVSLCDRSSLTTAPHLMLWQFPPNMQALKTLLQKSNAHNVYLVGGHMPDEDDANAFLRKMLGLVRFAVNQRDGQAEADKIAAALGTTNVAVALALSILKKIEVIDWFAEDGFVYLDLLGTPSAKAEDVPEYKQLQKCLREVVEFRQWFQSATINEIQLALVPAKGTEQPNAATQMQVRDSGDNFSGIHHDTANQLPSSYSG